MVSVQQLITGWAPYMVGMNCYGMIISQRCQGKKSWQRHQVLGPSQGGSIQHLAMAMCKTEEWLGHVLF